MLYYTNPDGYIPKKKGLRIGLRKIDGFCISILSRSDKGPHIYHMVKRGVIRYV